MKRTNDSADTSVSHVYFAPANDANCDVDCLLHRSDGDDCPSGMGVAWPAFGADDYLLP